MLLIYVIVLFFAFTAISEVKECGRKAAKKREREEEREIIRKIKADHMKGKSMTGTISNQEYTLRRDLLNDAIRETEEELKTLKQEREELDKLFYGKDNQTKDN